MSRETIVPAIPEIREDNLREVLTAIKSTLEVREGMIGDKLDQGVTLRDLVALNVAGTDQTNLATNNAGTKLPVSVVFPALPSGYDPTNDFSPPPAPTNFVAIGGFTNVQLDWNAAPYRNHSYTEVWRNTVDNLGTAVRVGITPADVYSDAVEPNTTYYYWIRFVSKANVYGPYNSTSGTPATTAIDVTRIIGDLSSQLTSSELFLSLGTRVGNNETQVSTLNSQYTVKIDNNGYVTGFGLASTDTTTNPTSTFAVRADTFYIANPAGPSVSPAMPFIVQTTATTINGESVPVGVYITDAFIQNGTIVSTKIGLAAITTAKIADAAITTAKIGDAQITTAKIVDASISSAKIIDAAITSAKIADASITSAKIATAAIGSAQIADASITTAEIQDAAITNAKIASLAVATANIQDGSISTAKIANAAITSATIQDAAVGTAKISDAAITNAKIGSLAVDTLNIQDFAVTVPAGVSQNNWAHSQNAWTSSLCSVTHDSRGADIYIVVSWTDYSAFLGLTSSCRILRNGTVLDTHTGQGSTIFVLSAPSGSQTYTIQLNFGYSSGASASKVATMIINSYRK